MFADERSYRHSLMFILNGIYDTLDFLCAPQADTEQAENERVVESSIAIFGKDNRYRLTLRSLAYGCSLEIRSLNPGGRMSVETERRLIGHIFSTLEQLIEDATEAGKATD